MSLQFVAHDLQSSCANYVRSYAMHARFELQIHNLLPLHCIVVF
ncbi:hypothetical protein [Helicobacter sp. UBA3407]|nr:hypothetical protein [Helicobacter sp. UBA3407]